MTRKSQPNFKVLQATGITLLLGIGMWALDQLLTGSLWESLHIQPKTLHFFCETSHPERFLRQTANSYTNLSYAWVGILIFLSLPELPRNLFVKRHSAYLWLYGGLALYTFIGSSLFHASLARLPEQIDLSAVYGIVALPLVFVLHRAFELRAGRSFSARYFLLAWAGWFIFSSIFTWQLRAHIVVPVLVVSTAFGIFHNGRVNPTSGENRWMAGLTACILAGIAGFVGDILRVGCYPDGVIHPHGLWHLMAALSAWCFFRYMCLPKSSSPEVSNLPDNA